MSRTRPRRYAAPVVVAALACAGLAGCGGSDGGDGDRPPAGTARTTATSGRMLDTEKVARAITESVRTQRRVKATVRCPADIPQRKGVNFVCRATSKFGVTEFAVVQRDGSGRVSYAAADDAR